MNKVKLAIVSVLALVGVMTIVPSYAVNASPAGEIKQGVTDVGGGAEGDDIGADIQTIVNMLLYILGAIAVVMIVIGGIRYTTSNGEASQITSAKNTIMYSVVGLVIAILAYAIVNWVVGAFE